MGELIPKPLNSVALPDVPNADSVTLDSEEHLVRGVLHSLLNTGENARACRDLLELLNQISRAKAKFETLISRTDLKAICDEFLDVVASKCDVDLSETRKQLSQKVDRLKNVQNSV